MAGANHLAVNDEERERFRVRDPRRTGADLFLLFGGAPVLVGLVNLGFVWLPPNLASNSWKFGLLGRTLEHLPVVVFSFALLAYGCVRHPGVGTTWVRTLSVVLVFGATGLTLWHWSNRDRGRAVDVREDGNPAEGQLALSAKGSTLLDRWLGRLRDAAREARGAFHRWMHPWRRRRALQSLRTIDPPSKILFVCHGNICRSPYAVGALRRDLDRSLRERIECRSAGFIGPNRASPPAAQQVARERSVDLTSHRSRLLEPEVVRSADLVFVMDEDQASAIRGRFRSVRVLLLGDLDTEAPDRRRIRDPINRPPVVFREVYERIDRCVLEVVSVLEERLPT